MNDCIDRGSDGTKHKTALRQFGVSITLLTIAGHWILGFEQSFAQPIVALLAGYSTQILLETIRARVNGVRPCYKGGIGKLVDFMLPTHVASLSIAMLLYFSDRLWVVAFASALAVASKTILRVPYKDTTRHFMNPSNLAISSTLLLFPSVSVTMPWQWTAEIHGYGNWVFPVVVFVLGTMLHVRFASRIWVVIAFAATFLIQAITRGGLLPEVNVLSTLAPATGVAAAIFTFYMVPDPATTPSRVSGQILFGASVALTYAILVSMHVVFAPFFALTIVCLGRGVTLALARVLRIGERAVRDIGSADEAATISTAQWVRISSFIGERL